VKILITTPKIYSEEGIKLPDNCTGQLALENVEFHYPTKESVRVLDSVNIGVDNNKKRVIALVGSSGCGKSSIISLLERFYDPTSGRVLFNGTDIKELNQRWYH
jgi:ATP-binding cassette subfamily B (MDR/TAP) protein 1